MVIENICVVFFSCSSTFLTKEKKKAAWCISRNRDAPSIPDFCVAESWTLPKFLWFPTQTHSTSQRCLHSSVILYQSSLMGGSLQHVTDRQWLETSIKDKT